MRSGIHFFNENVAYVLRKKRQLRNWISKTVEREGKLPGDINFIFCDDDLLAELNYNYLKHKTLTDILTFTLEEENGVLCGDIFISIPRVRENAVIFHQRLEDELHRVMIHGTLHLVGYKDATKKERLEMRAKENFYLELLSAV